MFERASIVFVISAAADDASLEHQIIAAVLAEVSRTVREISHDVQAEPSDPPLCRQLIEFGQRTLQRIEGPPVIIELDRQLTGVKTKSDLDPARRGAGIITVLDDIREQFLENYQQSSPFESRQCTMSGELLGHGDEPREFGEIVAQNQ